MIKPIERGHVFKGIAECLDTIGILSDVLAENTAAREASDEANPEEQLNPRCEAGVQAAIRLIAYKAYGDISRLATDLGVPE